MIEKYDVGSFDLIDIKKRAFTRAPIYMIIGSLFGSLLDARIHKREHESDIILHEAAARALRAHIVVDNKLPNPANFQAEYTRLTANKNALRTDYSKLIHQAREYGVVLKNVDSILNPGAEQRARNRISQVER